MKKKKLFLFMVSVAAILLANTYSVRCGIFSWLTDTITDNITDEIFTAINQSISYAIGSVLDWLFNLLLGPFGPQLNTFISNTNFGSISARDFLDGFAISVGMFVSTVLWGFSMFTYFFTGKITENKDNPLSMTLKYMIAIAICYKSRAIVDTFMGLVDILYTMFTKNAIGSVAKGAGFLNILGAAADGTLSMLGTTIVILEFPGIGFIILIIELILIWKLLKAFLQLYLEMVSRYIVSIVMLLLFPAFSGTAVSHTTSPIFKSYLRTLFSSFILMLFNILWFKMCFVAVLSGASVMNLLQYIFVLMLLRFGTKLDGILRSMGLGVATGVSRIGSAASGAGRNMAFALRNANDLRKAGGALLKAGGIATGNKAMFDAGMKVGAGTEDVARGGANTHPSSFAEAVGALNEGRKVSDSVVSNKESADIIQKAMFNPGNKGASAALTALSENKLREGAQYMMGDGYQVEKATPCQFRGDDGKLQTGMAIKAKTVDKEGHVSEKTFQGTLGSKAAFSSGQKLQNSDGLLQCKNSLKNGETCSIADSYAFAGQSVSNALYRAKSGGYELSDDGFVEKCGKDRNGLDTFNVFDEKGTQVGTISGSDFTLSAETMQDVKDSTADFSKVEGAYFDSTAMCWGKKDQDGNFSAFRSKESGLEDIKECIMGGVCHTDSSGKQVWGVMEQEESGNYVFKEGGTVYKEITDFSPVKDQKGVYKATATDEEGNCRDFIATDKGLNARSELNGHPESFMTKAVHEFNHNTMSYDVNAGKKYDPSKKSLGYEASNQKFSGKEERVEQNHLDSFSTSKKKKGVKRESSSEGKW